LGITRLMIYRIRVIHIAIGKWKKVQRVIKNIYCFVHSMYVVLFFQKIYYSFFGYNKQKCNTNLVEHTSDVSFKLVPSGFKDSNNGHVRNYMLVRFIWHHTITVIYNISFLWLRRLRLDFHFFLIWKWWFNNWICQHSLILFDY